VTSHKALVCAGMTTLQPAACLQNESVYRMTAVEPWL